jgi:CheY-like chemotaxis protein
MMPQANATVAVMTEDPALHERVHDLLSEVELPEIHCFGHRDVSPTHQTTPDLIVVAIPRDQIRDLTAALDTLVQDPALAHLPVLVYIAEAEQEGLLEACVGGVDRHVPARRAALGETDRSLDDGMPGGRADL